MNATPSEIIAREIAERFPPEGTLDSEPFLPNPPRPGGIIGIDPGTEQSAIVAIGPDGGVCPIGILPNAEVLKRISRAFEPPAEIAIEMIASYGMPVGREVFETCLWIGRFIQRAQDFGNTAHLIFRRDVKHHLCNSAKAKDANVSQALRDKFGGMNAVGTKKNKGPLYGIKSHLWPALAVAVTFAETR